ncbi:MAG TPA: superinfection immunity protein [Pseudolabrys sp.]|nr:superinfection immunity protein [Pseudolabrys sp.]
MPAGDLPETRFYGAMTVVGNAIFILCMYFLPALISALHWHHNQNAIFLTNLFFDWTVIGWVAALIWCSTTNPVDRYKEGDA